MAIRATAAISLVLALCLASVAFAGSAYSNAPNNTTYYTPPTPGNATHYTPPTPSVGTMSGSANQNAVTATPSDMDAARAASDSTGGSILNNINSKSGIQNNLTNPVVSSGTPMSTLGQVNTAQYALPHSTTVYTTNSAFNSQVSCPASSAFLQVFIHPNGNNDLDLVTIQQDTTFSGKNNYTYQVPVIVSGVCANGIISCDPGTWGNCKYYAWVADPVSYKASIQQVNPTNLGGCYCINNSCGNNLAVNDMAQILNNLGGGMAGAVQATNTHFAISNSSINGPVIYFYGQDASGCTTVGGGYPGSTNPQSYYTASSLISGDTQTLVQNEAPTSTSMYSLLTNPLLKSSNAASVLNCSITRTESVAQDQVACITSSSYPKQIFKVYRSDGEAAQWNQIGTTSTYTLEGGACIGMILDITAVQNNVEGCIYSSGCNECPTGIVSVVYDGTCPLAAPNSGCDNTVSAFNIFPTCNGDSLALTTDDTCASVSSSCSLVNEVVDGVSTVTNYVSTGLSPIQSCRTFDGTFSHNVCEEWWQKNRTYICPTTSAYDFTDTGKRVAYIQGSVEANGSNYVYNDETLGATGNWITTSNNPLDMQSLDSYGDCEQACEVKAPITNTEAGINMNVSQTNVTTQTFNFYYRTCTGLSCPTNAGETIVQNCQCIDQFANAASVMQTLRMSGQDLVCSSGTPQPLK